MHSFRAHELLPNFYRCVRKLCSWIRETDRFADISYCVDVIWYDFFFVLQTRWIWLCIAQCVNNLFVIYLYVLYIVQRLFSGKDQLFFHVYQYSKFMVVHLLQCTVLFCRALVLLHGYISSMDWLHFIGHRHSSRAVSWRNWDRTSWISDRNSTHQSRTRALRLAEGRRDKSRHLRKCSVACRSSSTTAYVITSWS
jgi:hypothetical protein